MTKQLVIYVAGPYTPRHQDLHNAAWEANRNVHRAMEIAWEVFKKGHIPVLPHLCHFFQIFTPEPMSYDWFMRWEKALLTRCDAILRFARSPGADQEYDNADEAGLILFNDIKEIPECHTSTGYAEKS